MDVSAPHLTCCHPSPPSSPPNADGIKALLDKLKSSEAWQQAISAVDPPPPLPAPACPPESRGDPSTHHASVASLLAQLADTSAGCPPPEPPEPRLGEAGSLGRSPAPSILPPQRSIGSDKRDLHTFSFQQTLSYLAQLSTKQGVVESIHRVRHHTGDHSVHPR